MQRVARGGDRWILGLTLGCLLAAGVAARADDVTTLSGQTFRDVHVVRVDPDGVTWQHATGVVKVDFADLPEAVRRVYHYDAGRAKVYQEAQAKAQAEFAARSQQVLRDADARRVQRFQGEAVEGGRPGEFVYHRQDAVVETLARSFDAQDDARKAARARLTEDDGTIWDRRLWAIPSMILGHSDGHAFDRPVPKQTFDIDPKLMAPSWAERVKADIGY